MINHIKFWANMLLIPVYIMLFFILSMPELFKRCYEEIADGIKYTKRKYNIK
jgi:hypothetical protein